MLLILIKPKCLGYSFKVDIVFSKILNVVQVLYVVSDVLESNYNTIALLWDHDHPNEFINPKLFQKGVEQRGKHFDLPNTVLRLKLLPKVKEYLRRVTTSLLNQPLL